MTFNIIAHRGKGPTSNLPILPVTQAPENTIAAFEQALSEGADGIELDVAISKDNQIVVTHDDELNRNVFGANRDINDLGYTSDYTVSELKNFDMGHGHRIPTLAEVFDLVADKNPAYKAKTGKNLVVNIELKGENVVDQTYDTLMKCVEEGKIEKESVIFNSFKWDRLRAMRAKDDEVKLVPNVKTTQFFGIENVQMPGFSVKSETPYTEECKKSLQDLHAEINCHAFDCVINDVRPELVGLCKANNIGLCSSTSCERVDGNSLIPILHEMHDYSQELPFTLFKADDARMIIGLKMMMESKNDLNTNQMTVPDDGYAIETLYAPQKNRF